MKDVIRLTKRTQELIEEVRTMIIENPNTSEPEKNLYKDSDEGMIIMLALLCAKSMYRKD